MVLRPRDLASRMAAPAQAGRRLSARDLSRCRATRRGTRARDFLNRYPKAAYMSAVESWRELPGGDIEFTMRRLASAVKNQVQSQFSRPIGLSADAGEAGLIARAFSTPG